MSGTKKAVRLGKAARDFNVGISTIVEHLSNEGIEIESSPNTKLEPELYDKLLAAFKSDQELKEKDHQDTKLHCRIPRELRLIQGKSYYRRRSQKSQIRPDRITNDELHSITIKYNS